MNKQESGNAGFYSIRFATMVEENMTQRVRCEVREGREVFVFDSGGNHKVVVPVEEYLEILRLAQENKTQSTYGIPNRELA